MTSYTILRATRTLTNPDDEVSVEVDALIEVGKVDAPRADAAVSQWAAEQTVDDPEFSGGEFVAVPTKNITRTTVTVDRKPRVQVNDVRRPTAA